MKAGVSVRPAGDTDTERIAELETSALGRDAWSPALVAEGVAARLPTISYLVAETDDLVIGYVVVSVAGEDAELQRIAVDADARRKGVASSLLTAGLAHAVRHGAERMLLEVREDNAGARDFYASTGFTEIGRRPRYYRDGATAVILQRPATMEP